MLNFRGYHKLRRCLLHRHPFSKKGISETDLDNLHAGLIETAFDCNGNSEESSGSL